MCVTQDLVSSTCVTVCVCVCVCLKKLNLKRRDAKHLRKWKRRRHRPNQDLNRDPQLTSWLGGAFFSTFANASLPLLFRFNLSPLLQRRNYKAFSENSEPWTAVIVCVCLSEKCVITKTLYQALEWLFHKRYAWSKELTCRDITDIPEWYNSICICSASLILYHQEYMLRLSVYNFNWYVTPSNSAMLQWPPMGSEETQQTKCAQLSLVCHSQ